MINEAQTPGPAGPEASSAGAPASSAGAPGAEDFSAGTQGGWMGGGETASSTSGQEAAASAAADVAGERPELIVAGAFAAGFLAALIIKRIAR